MIGGERSFDKLCYHPASFQTISSVSVDWSALSPIISISFSNNGEVEINSEMVKSNEVQSAIPILEDGQREIDTGEFEITYERITEIWRSTTLEGAAKQFGVTKTVLKRTCSKLGILRWPRGRHLPSSPRLKDAESVEIGQCSPVENETSTAKSTPLGDIARGASTAMENGETDQGNIIAVMEAVTNGVDAITRGDIPIEAVEAEVPTGQHFIMSVKATYMGKTEMFLWSSGIEELRRELGKRFRLEVGRFDIKYMDRDGDWITLSYDEDLRLCLDTLKASKQSTLKLELSTEEVGITLEKINQYRGFTTQQDAADKLGVHLSTLKRRCKELRLGSWPYSKRKNGHCLPSSARVLKKTKGQCSNADAIEIEDAATKSVPLSEIARDKSTATGNDEFDRKNDIIAVLATYKDDTVPFPLYCNSGIEELRKELDDSFQIEGEKYKIKYEREDGRWITLLRDTHLRFHIETLKASGQSTMEISVFPDSL